jgi:hypothetical protein
VNLNLGVLQGWLLGEGKMGKSVFLELLYRGTRDGFNQVSFHAKLDGKGPLLFITQSSGVNPRVFGGYTTLKWTRREQIQDNHQIAQSFPDKDSYIFSLTFKTKLK